ncbi:hypothetical protein K227x_49490 [Rubripirellula lacrimiformis]|uniref:Uncharacterized protein n=1 Tax=Rubripirellula lacrimiformis TaxID=1930273 RepID=A0A517NHC5_9BACT|nr:hypothetical protein [Rubripirellula lacrimiformis]QDT06539.1 hypothetical protein K227x_49490 [Rubripirellula lacrimiformis]
MTATFPFRDTPQSEKPSTLEAWITRREDAIKLRFKPSVDFQFPLNQHSTTYAFSPDLKLEGNPAMSSLGFPVIIALNIAIVATIALMTYSWWRHPAALRMPVNADDVWAFASLNYFNAEYPRRTFLYKFMTKLPTNWRLAIQMTGLVLSSILVVGSCMAVFSWFAVHDWHLLWYRKAYLRTHFAFPYLLLLPVFLAVTALYFKAEHARIRIKLNGE